MTTAILTLIGNVLGGLGGWFTLQSQKLTLKNAAPMVANDEARKRLELEEKFEKDVDSGDIEKARIDSAHP